MSATTDDSLAARLDGSPPPPPPSGDLEAKRAREAARAMLFGGAAPLQIGRYRVTGRIGAGGMGVVLAARDEQLRREVAIKVLHATRGDGRAQARLRREAEALARISDPHVVQVFEVGRHEGQLFIAMELVDGTTLRAWQCAPGRRAEEILAMYRRAGLGLVAAHRVGLVHRDFKPDNVLVGPDERPRVADFGLVRSRSKEDATDREQSEQHPSAERELVLSRTESVMGTLAYMAPEQHRGSAVEAAADQFSFCVALWEALWGERPFAGGTRFALAEATLRGDIRPPPGITRAQVPIRRVLERGLAPQPANRWPSMSALLDALEPARLRRSHRGLWLAGTSGFALVATALAWPGTAASVDCDAAAHARMSEVWGSSRRLALRDAIVAGAGERASSIWGRMAPAIDEWSEAWRNRQVATCEAGRQPAGAEDASRVDRQQACLDRALARVAALIEAFEVPGARVDAAISIFGRLDDLAACADPAPALQDDLADPVAAPELASKQQELVAVQAAMDAGHYEPSLPRAEALVARATELSAEMLATRAQLVAGEAKLLSGDMEGAKAALEATFHAAERLGLDEEVAASGLALADLNGLRLADYPQADRWIRHTEAAVERTGTRRAKLEFTRAAVLSQQGLTDEGIERMREALRLAEIDPGKDDPFYFDVVDGLGASLISAGRPDEAVLQHRLAVELIERAQGPDHPSVVVPLSNLGTALLMLDEYEEAVVHLERAVEMRREQFGRQHFEVARIELNLGLVYLRMGDLELARHTLQSAVDGMVPVLGADHPYIALAHTNLADARDQAGDHEGAIAELREAVRIVDLTPRQLAQRAELHERLGNVLVHRGRSAEARLEHETALALWREARGPDDPSVAQASSRLGMSLFEQGDYAEARRHLEAAAEIFARAETPNGKELGIVHYYLGATASRDGTPAAAEAELRAALELFERGSAPAQLQVAAAQLLLGKVLAEQGRVAEARSALERAISIYRGLPGHAEDLADAERALAGLR